MKFIQHSTPSHELIWVPGLTDDDPGYYRKPLYVGEEVCDERMQAMPVPHRKIKSTYLFDMLVVLFCLLIPYSVGTMLVHLFG